MKTLRHRQAFRRGLLAILGINLALVASLTLTHAADRTWNGAGDGVTMSSGANWAGGVAPVANDTLFFDGAAGLAPNNDIAAATLFKGITFNAGAGAFVISGNQMNIANSAGITNNSSFTQIINAPLNQPTASTRVHDAATADLVYKTLGGQTITKQGSFAVWLAGTGNNTGLQATVNNGTLILAKESGNAIHNGLLNGGPTVNANGTLRLQGPGTDQINSTLRVNLNGGKFQVAFTNGLVSPSSEEILGLSGTNVNSIVENGLADSTNTLIVGNGNGRRAIYGGIICDGAGVFNLRVIRHDNSFIFNGTHTYTGTTEIQNNQNAGITRLILNGTHVGGGAYTISSSQTPFANGALLGGTGIVSAAVANFNAASFLSPGGNFTSESGNSTVSETTGILTFSNAVNLADATATLDVQLNSTNVGSGYDQVVIAGSGSFSNNSANLKLAVQLGFTPAAGTRFTLVKVQGTDPSNNVGTFATLDGVATDLSQGAEITDALNNKFRISYRAEGSTFDAGEGLGNDIMLEALASAASDLTWRGDVNNVWDIGGAANWRDTNGVAATFTDGDFVTFDDTGANSQPLDITTALNPAKFLFDATKDYVLAGAGSFNGAILLTKTNTGALTVLTENSNSGTTIIEQGTVRVGTNGFTGTISSDVIINPNGTLDHSRADDVTFNPLLTGSGSLLHTGDGALILAANNTFSGRTTNSGGVLQLGTGANGDVGRIQGDVHVSGTKVLRYYYDGNGTVTLGNTRSGDGTVLYEVYTGNRTFSIPSSLVSSNFSGSNYIGVGVRLQTVNGNPGYGIGNGGSVTVADYAQAFLDGTSVPYNQEFFLQGNGWTGDATPLGALRIYNCTVSGPVHLLANTRMGGTTTGGTIIGQVDGAFQLEVLGNANSFILSLGPTNGPNTYGSTLVTRGAIRALNSGGISSGPLTVDLQGEVNVFGNNVTVASLNNGLGGAGVIYNKSTTNSGTLTVGTDDTSTYFDGVFGDGASKALGLIKAGAGTLWLSGVNTNTGDVTVNGGTLALTGSGSFDNAASLAVANGATLDVSGRFDGTLTLAANQTLTSSGANVGPIAVNGNLTVGSGRILLALNRANSPATNATLAVSGTLTPGGTLAVTNVGPALVAGDSFQLFPGAQGGFSVSLQGYDPVNNVTYFWTDTVSTDGKVTVAAVGQIPDYRSRANGDWNDFNTWELNFGSGWANAVSGQTPNGAYGHTSVEIKNSHTVTVATAATSANLKVNTNGNLTVNGVLNVNRLVGQTLANNLTVEGILNLTTTNALALGANSTNLIASGGVLNHSGAPTVVSYETGAQLIINGAYVQNITGSGAIPIATWGAASTCRIDSTFTASITAGTAPFPNLNYQQTFGNFIWNAQGGTTHGINFMSGASAALTNWILQGTLTVEDTGGNPARLHFANLNTVLATNKGFFMSGGNFGVANVNSHMTVDGPIALGGGAFASSGTAGAASLTALGDVSFTNSVAVTGNGLAVSFAKAGAQNWTVTTSSIDLSGPSWTVNSGSAVTYGNASFAIVDDLTVNGSLDITGNSTLLVNGSATPSSTNSGSITVAGGSTLGGDGAIGASITLSPGARMTNNVPGGLLTLTNSLTLNGNTLDVATGNPLAPGDYLLITNTIGGITGSFAGVVISGAGLAADTTGSLVTTASGVTLQVVSTLPVITSTVVIGSDLIISGTSATGIAGGTYYVRSTNDVAIPIASWPRISTNTYGVGGAFSATNQIPPGVPVNFYRIEQ